MKFIQTSAFWSLFLIAKMSFGSTVEAELHLPWNYMGLHVNLQKNAFEVETAHFEFQGVPLDLNHVKVEIDATSQELTQSQNPPLRSQLKVGNISFQIKIPAFQVKKDVVRDIGGARIIVRLEAECNSFVIRNKEIRSEAQFDWLYDEKSVHAHLTDLSVNWPESNWSLSEIQCRGPLGFADLIQAEITHQLAHPEMVLPILKDKIQEYTNLRLAELSAQAMNFRLSFLNDRLQAEVSRIKNLNSLGLTLAIQMTAKDDSAQNFSYVNSPATVQVVRKDQQPILSLPRAGLEQILKSSADGQMFSSSEDQLSGFKKLMRSRFLQFFFWPDLMNFNKSAPFKFIHHIGSSAKNTPSATKIELNENANFKLQLQGESWLQGEREQKMWNYVFFKTSLKANGKLEIANSKLNLKIDSRELKISKQFGKDYVKKFRPSERISLSTIQSSLEASFLNSALSLELPILETKSGAKFKIQNLSVDADSNFNFSFKDSEK